MSDVTYYRNRETGLIQSHPVSGIGDSLNSDEVGEDAKPLLSLAPSADDHKRASNARKDQSKTPAASASGDSNKQEGTK